MWRLLRRLPEHVKHSNEFLFSLMQAPRAVIPKPNPENPEGASPEPLIVEQRLLKHSRP